MNLILLLDGDFADPAQARACASGASLDGSMVARVVLRDRRLRHLREVHHAEVGRELVVGRLGGVLGRGVVTHLDDERVELQVRLDAPPPPKLPLTLLLALPRPKTLRRVLQAVAAMGVERLVLMNSWRVEKSFWSSPALESAAIEVELHRGLEQGKDTVPPRVQLQRLLRPFVERELETLAAGTRRLIAHPDATSACPRALDEPVTLALGPEGGFIAREIDLFARHGFEPVSLGPRPLRVEHAVPALIGRLF